MLEYAHYVNKEYDEEEQALEDLATNTIVLKGDYYHDNIQTLIEGFLQGVEHVQGGVSCQVFEIDRRSPDFQRIGFCEGDDYELEEDCDA